MSNKEKKLQKNLCKALTEYLLYDNKNSSRSLETAQYSGSVVKTKI